MAPYIISLDLLLFKKLKGAPWGALFVDVADAVRRSAGEYVAWFESDVNQPITFYDYLI
jgi:hypothetical protein